MFQGSTTGASWLLMNTTTNNYLLLGLYHAEDGTNASGDRICIRSSDLAQSTNLSIHHA